MEGSVHDFLMRFGIMEDNTDPMPVYDAYETDDRRINEIQRLQFELLRRVRYNEFNGAKVVEDLLNWRDRWYAVIGDRCGSSTGKLHEPVIDLIRLRDMPRNIWNVDFVFIWTDAANVDELQAMIKERWQSDAMEVLSEEEVFRSILSTTGKDDRFLAIWWD